MPLKSFRPLPNAKGLPKNAQEKMKYLLKDDWDNSGAKPHHFLTYEDFIVLYCQVTDLPQQVIIKTKEKKEKPLPNDLPDEIKIEIERLKAKHQLNQKHIDKLVRLIKKKEIENLEIEKQIQYLRSQAGKMSDDRRIQKIKDRFHKAYDKFLSVLDSDLYELSPSDKEEIRTKLKSMSDIIDDTSGGLK